MNSHPQPCPHCGARGEIRCGTCRDRAKAHAQFLALGLHCTCGYAKREDEAVCASCRSIGRAA